VDGGSVPLLCLALGLVFALFAVSSVLQFVCHRYLAGLRASDSSSASQNAYFLPTFRPFRWVACPHYFAEILIYASIFSTALLLRSSARVSEGASVLWRFDNWESSVALPIPLSLCLLFVCLNLTITALKTRRVYAEKFREQFEVSTKAIIPFCL